MARVVCRLDVAMDPEWKDRVERYAAEQGLRQNGLIVAALEHYFRLLDGEKTLAVMDAASGSAATNSLAYRVG